MDIEGLEELSAQPTTSAMILCNPHNPVGRVWTKHELTAVSKICAANDVFVISDEIHADVVLGDVVPGGQPGFEQQVWPPGVGDLDTVDLDPHVARAG